MDNLTTTLSEEATNGNQYLPLDFFYQELKENDFAITPYQIINANKVIIEYADKVKNEAELCNFLMPLFASSEEEQKLFKEIYQKYFTTGIERTATRQHGRNYHIQKNWKKFIGLYALFAGILIYLLILFTARNFYKPAVIIGPEKDPADIVYYISTSKTPVLNELNTTPILANTNKPIQLFVFAYYKYKKQLNISNIKYDWGDSTGIDTASMHTYKSPGKYIVDVLVDITDDDFYLKKQPVHSTINVCNNDIFLNVVSSSKNDTIISNKKITLTAKVSDTNPPDEIRWDDDNGQVLGYGKEIETTFTIAGKHSITCLAIYDSVGSACTLRKKNTFFIPQSNVNLGPETDISKTTTLNTTKGYVSPLLYYLWRISLAIFLVLSIVFIILSEKAKIKIQGLKNAAFKRYDKIKDALSGKRSPKSVPFKNKNYLPIQEHSINAVAKQMRKRINDTISYLHVGKTISKTIANNGLFEPVHLARTRQSEYLILVDENNSNCQQTKLFEYLITVLKKQNVLIDTYYYRSIPEFFYNTNEPNGNNLEKLNNRFKNHVLLIFGDANHFIHNDSLAFEEKYLSILDQWQYKAIVTPVSFLDWDAKEKKIILPVMPIFPADIQGLVILSELMFSNTNEINIINRLNQSSGLFYNSRHIDNTSISELEKYCDNFGWAKIIVEREHVNVLFEWIKALAVYPKIRWELILTIGRSIFIKYGKTRELNFTSLLFITRINWIKQGIWPEDLRLELLNSLSVENEQLARETVLMLLKEIPESEANQNVEEKEIQQVINEFRLYALDPVFYSMYKESKEVFEKLWNENKISDATLTAKFKADKTSWKILDKNANEVSAGIEEYFESQEKEDTLLSKLYLWLGIISIIVTVSSFFALLMLGIWENGN